MLGGWPGLRGAIGAPGEEGSTVQEHPPETEAAGLISNEARVRLGKKPAHAPLGCSAGLWANVGVGLTSQLCWGPAAPPRPWVHRYP